MECNGKALQRPVLSPDGTLLALIAPDQKVHLISLVEAVQSRRFITAIKTPRSSRTFVQECHILHWSPETITTPTDADEILSNTTSECDFGLRWLLLSNGHRLIALSTDLKSPRMMPRIDDNEDCKPSNILADYELGGQLGKVSLAEFVFNHRRALVMFEYGGTAAILSLTKPQREDIPHVKFSDSRSLAIAPHNRRFALLRREKGQDRVTVFDLEEGNNITYRSFDINTSDAQSITWCLAGDPVIAVCDSPSYGVKVYFFTAQGHPLKQLDISAGTFTRNHPPIDKPLDADSEGPGLTHWQWRRDGNRTIQIAANSQNQVLIRYQSAKSMSTQTVTAFTHPDTIDGSHTFVWQEMTSPTDATSAFTRQTGMFDPTEPDKQTPNSAQIDIISLNSDHTFIATRIRSAPRTLLLWRLCDVKGHPHTALILTHPIRQIHWHPTLSNVLVILTTRRQPLLYAWYQEHLPPVTGLLPIDATSTNYSASWLPECIREDDTQRRCPMLITSSTAFEVGYLQTSDGRIMFESIINPDSYTHGDGRLNGEEEEQDQLTDQTSTLDEMTIDIDTPSRKGPSSGHGSRKQTRFAVDPNPRTDKEDPLFAQTKWGRW
ncbi:hypothetical protein LTR10_017713 [Elasticomyces elasticus]|uniref:Anaphase-promoting complex subunit 4 WD40 domain-containing protein n=1 Tax=Exophiala sideris TaxID=1016849 RepID=A0ABR0JBE7_9EURO|nr:hypothetical protein LTR10_017713 [Elasticomyces elasticus]KAK5031038.1 hypothetical protein LTS07_004773 [Exophiala sideris]KAK5038760.1 hypothetical protein LTR13_003791 [Exophiala sideris]KAK5060643.1 hypothetical protein LTR69_005242 [Exophiala sideris]KAK5183556.1 hypothetical protein LTR44_003838 [Eurotiomycetes sp. CCFEE 6388]